MDNGTCKANCLGVLCRHPELRPNRHTASAELVGISVVLVLLLMLAAFIWALFQIPGSVQPCAIGDGPLVTQSTEVKPAAESPCHSAFTLDRQWKPLPAGSESRLGPHGIELSTPCAPNVGRVHTVAPDPFQQFEIPRWASHFRMESGYPVFTVVGPEVYTPTDDEPGPTLARATKGSPADVPNAGAVSPPKPCACCDGKCTDVANCGCSSSLPRCEALSGGPCKCDPCKCGGLCDAVPPAPGEGEGELIEEIIPAAPVPEYIGERVPDPRKCKVKRNCRPRLRFFRRRG